MKTIQQIRRFNLNQWGRMAYVLGSGVVYMMAFFLLYPTRGAESAALVVLPVIAMAWYFGLWAGLLGGVLAFPCNALLLHWVGGMDWNAILEQSGPAALGGMVVGATTGLLHDRYERLRHELAHHQTVEQGLRDVSNTTLLDAMPDLMVRLNRRGDILDYKTPVEQNLFPSRVSLAGMKNGGRELSNAFDKLLAFIVKTQNDGIRQVFEIQLPGINALELYEIRMVASGPHEVVAVVRNIGESRDAEAKLRYNEDLLQQAIRIAGLGIWEWEIAPNVTTWSGEMFRNYGITPESFSGDGEQYFDFTHPEDRQKQRDNVDKALERARRGAETDRNLDADPVEVRIIRADGSECTVLGDAVAFTNPEGQPTRMVGFLFDITQQKRAEQRRFDLAVVKERNDLLQQFLANVSHDLKTPLSVINTSIHLLERLTTPEQQKQQIQIIKTQTILLEDLIQDIMTLSELKNIVQLVMQPVDVNNLIRDVETHFRFLAEQGQLAVSLALTPDPPPIRGNPEELNRAIIQLVENALDHTPTSGQILLRTTELENTIAIEISDTGVGISPADLPHIFDPFYRVDKARASNKGGSGLGLAIVKQIVALHQGSVNVQSTEGEGTTFRILLPLISTQALDSH